MGNSKSKKECCYFLAFDDAREFAKFAATYMEINAFVRPVGSGWEVECPEFSGDLEDLLFQKENSERTEWERIMDNWYEHFDEYDKDPDGWWHDNYAPSTDFESYNEYWDELWNFSDH